MIFNEQTHALAADLDAYEPYRRTISMAGIHLHQLFSTLSILIQLLLIMLLWSDYSNQGTILEHQRYFRLNDTLIIHWLGQFRCSTSPLSKSGTCNDIIKNVKRYTLVHPDDHKGKNKFVVSHFKRWGSELSIRGFCLQHWSPLKNELKLSEQVKDIPLNWVFPLYTKHTVWHLFVKK